MRIKYEARAKNNMGVVVGNHESLSRKVIAMWAVGVFVDQPEVERVTVRKNRFDSAGVYYGFENLYEVAGARDDFNSDQQKTDEESERDNEAK